MTADPEVFEPTTAKKSLIFQLVAKTEQERAEG